MLDFLRLSLAALNGRDRLLVLDYHDDEGGKQYERREQLAAEFGLKPNALRVRVARESWRPRSRGV